MFYISKNQKSEFFWIFNNFLDFSFIFEFCPFLKFLLDFCPFSYWICTIFLNFVHQLENQVFCASWKQMYKKWFLLIKIRKLRNFKIFALLTLSFKAFLLKKALQLSQVTALKLYPKALSPQTEQTLDFSPFVSESILTFYWLLMILSSGVGHLTCEIRQVLPRNTPTLSQDLNSYHNKFFDNFDLKLQIFQFSKLKERERESCIKL